jgi:hypothetical protein
VFLVGDGTRRTTWLVDRYDPAAHRIAYVVSGRKTLTRILIEVHAYGSGSQATVTEIKTALTPWEAAINAAL